MSKEKKRKVIEDKTKDGLVYFEIWGILFILFSLILVSELGPVGRTLNALAKIIFGDWYWLILIFMFYYGVMMIIYHEFITYSSIKIKGFIFISAGLLIYSHFPIYAALKNQLDNSNIVTESYNLFLGYLDKQIENGTYGGGLLGAFLFWITYALLGTIGTHIIAIILIISGIAYLFEKTVYDFMDDLYFGTIKTYKSAKTIIKNTFTKMNEASKASKTQSDELVTENVSLNRENHKFDNIVMTSNEKVEIKKSKYSRPNIKTLKYHDNKQVLENQKEVTIQNAKVINDFLKSFFLNLEVSEVYIGPTISTYIIEIENSMKSKKILNYKKDLIMRLETDHIRMYEKYESKQCLVIEIPNEYRYLVSLREIIEEDETENFVPIGRNFCGQIYAIQFEKMSNILVLGNDINSKIDFLKTVIYSITYKFTPDDFKLVLCDSTRFELNEFEYNHHLFYPFINDFQSMKPMLIKLYTEVEQRLTQLEDKNKKFTPILLILNDCVDFYLNNQDYLKYLNYVLVYGGKVGLYTIFATNNMDDKILTNNLRAQFDGILSFLINSKEMSFKYLEDDTTDLLKNGDCIIYSRTENTSIRVQLVNYDEEE